VITDDFVDRHFGTGAVKVTPAHDPNDFLIGQRHTMEPVVVIDEGGLMCGDIPEKYIGLDRFECRKRVVEDMKKEGLLEKTEDHVHAVGHCYRCDTIVEPYYSDQWFVKMKPLAEKALQAALDNEIVFYPQRWRKTYIEWMENTRDWCISRQIWWGHRIPVWYCNDCNEIVVAEDTPNRCSTCGSQNLTQDEDVLDTWFSSWLWPFSTMGWPEETALIKKFYPTDVLVTAPEILFFWVARMIMAGLYCTGKLPFRDIMLHGTVRDDSGRKMSKSLGNSIDPLEIISNYGADALRFSMIMITAQGADVYMQTDTFDIGRNFANKLWNASRFLIGNIDKSVSFKTLPESGTFKTEDRWILSRLNRAVQAVRSAIDSFKLNEACHIIYDFTWHDFCDWYVEAKKSDLYQSDDPARKENALNLCSYLLANILKLLHPFMPFITEEIWGHLGNKVNYPAVIDSNLIFNTSFPETVDAFTDEEIENNFSLLKEIIVALRTIRSENNVPPEKRGSAVIIPANTTIEAWLNNQKALINMFAGLDKTTIDSKATKPQFAGQAVIKGIQVFLELEGLINREIEIARLDKEIEHLKNIAEKTKNKIENEHFITRAPEAVVNKEKEKYEGILLNLEKLQKNLKELTD
jgi:valyl-tRNA synthetase